MERPRPPHNPRHTRMYRLPLRACCSFNFPSLHNGRIGLVDHAAYCHSPLTDQGTKLALLGANVLAAEIMRQPDNPRAAYATYEQEIGPFVRERQQIPPGGNVSRLAQPQAEWGMWTLRTSFRLIMSMQVWRVFQFGEDPMKVELPRYEWKCTSCSWSTWKR